MRDLSGLILSVALPWLAGTLWLRSLSPPVDRRGWALAAGYGYLAGAFAVTLVLRGLDIIGVRWTLLAAALPMAMLALAGGALLCVLSRRGKERRRLVAMATDSPWRLLFWFGLILLGVRFAGLALEVAWRLLLPYDAWAQWATKTRVWYEYGRMVPFVLPDEWLRSGDPMKFMDMHSNYPGTVPLLQVWTNLCLGRWDESLMNAPWLALFVALGLAFYAQLRRAALAPWQAMVYTYLLLSLPFLDIHIALAGVADVFVAATYGLAAIALWQWSLTRERRQLLLALLMALICSLTKVEGMLWSLTLLPAVLVAYRRRAGVTAIAVIVAAMLLYLVVGPTRIELFGYVLRTEFRNVSVPVLQHLFVMDNWHLLWYAAVVVAVLRRRILLGADLLPLTVTILSALTFVGIVFFFSSASGGVEDESLVNRLPLHMVPALVFYLALLLQRGAGSDAARSAAPAASTAV